MSNFQTQLKRGAWAGIKSGWKSFVWMCEIVIPISFLTTLLQWTGWLRQLDFLLKPLMSLLNLPAEAALPTVSGMLINIYAVIAILTVVPFSLEQMTLIAIFNLIAHNLILEGIIQFRSGINVVKTTLIRIVTAFLTTFIVSRFLGNTNQRVTMPANFLVHTALSDVLKVWPIDIAALLLKIFGLIMAIMIILQISRSLGWIDRLFNPLKPVMRILGLPGQAALIFITGIIFGLLYGGAVIVDEGKKGTLTKEEVEQLHISLGINHSMVEDPVLFAMLGVNLFWLWVPRLIMAIIFVQASRLVRRFRDKFLHI